MTEYGHRAETPHIFEGFSERKDDGATRKDASLQEALENLWENAAGQGERRLRVIEIEIYGSNPIDMFRVIGTDG